MIWQKNHPIPLSISTCEGGGGVPRAHAYFSGNYPQPSHGKFLRRPLCPKICSNIIHILKCIEKILIVNLLTKEYYLHKNEVEEFIKKLICKNIDTSWLEWMKSQILTVR